jgi:hypothetical protein
MRPIREAWTYLAGGEVDSLVEEIGLGADNVLVNLIAV